MNKTNPTIDIDHANRTILIILYKLLYYLNKRGYPCIFEQQIIMNFFKSKGDHQVSFELSLTPVSITLVPPPSVAVSVFLRISREQKNLFTSMKYTLETGQQGTRKTINFQGEIMKTTNKFQASLSKEQKKSKVPDQSGLQWAEKEVWISVQSEGLGGNVQTIGSQRLNLSKYVAQNNLQPYTT